MWHACMCAYVVCDVYASRIQKRMQDNLELDYGQLWVLGTKLRSLGRAESPLDPWATTITTASPHSQIHPRGRRRKRKWGREEEGCADALRDGPGVSYLLCGGQMVFHHSLSGSTSHPAGQPSGASAVISMVSCQLANAQGWMVA